MTFPVAQKDYQAAHEKLATYFRNGADPEDLATECLDSIKENAVFYKQPPKMSELADAFIAIDRVSDISMDDLRTPDQARLLIPVAGARSLKDQTEAYVTLRNAERGFRLPEHYRAVDIDNSNQNADQEMKLISLAAVKDKTSLSAAAEEFTKVLSKNGGSFNTREAIVEYSNRHGLSVSYLPREVQLDSDYLTKYIRPSDVR